MEHKLVICSYYAPDLSTIGLYIVHTTRFSISSVNINFHIFSLIIHETHPNIKFPKQLQKASHNQYLEALIPINKNTHSKESYYDKDLRILRKPQERLNRLYCK